MNEKELAVQMWEEIKEQIKGGKLDNGLEIYAFKKSFTEKHNLYWGNANCYLCEKFKYCCSVCPIGSMVSKENDFEKYYTNREPCYSSCVYYYVVANQTESARKELKTSPRSKKFKMEVRLEACDKIIEAIKSM